MVWILFVALFVIALVYALLLKVEPVAYTTPYRKDFRAGVGSFDD